MFHLQPLQFAVRSAARSGFIARIGFTLAELPTVIAVTGTLVALLPPVLLAETQFRTWTSISGKHTLEAEYVRVEGDKVILRKADGSLSQPVITQLSEADQEFIEKMQSIPKPVLPAEEEQEETDAAEEESGIQRYISYGKFGLRDKNGAIFTPAKYYNIDVFHEGLAVVRLDNMLNAGYGFVDETGKEIIESSLSSYNKVEPFSEGLARVGKNFGGGWGFIDKTGREVIPLKYTYVKDFSEGLAAVKLGGGFGFVYDPGGQWGFVDKTGKEVIPLKYTYVKDFSEGLAAVIAEVGLGDRWGFIDKTGREVIPLNFGLRIDFLRQPKVVTA